MRRLLLTSLALAIVVNAQADYLWGVYLHKSLEHKNATGTGTASGLVGVESGSLNAAQASSITSSQYAPKSQQGTATDYFEMGIDVYWYDDTPPTLYVLKIESGGASTQAGVSGSGAGGGPTSASTANASGGATTAPTSSAGGMNYSESHTAPTKVTKTNLRYTNCQWDVYQDLGGGHKIYKLRGYLAFNTGSASASGSVYCGGYYPTTPPWSRTVVSQSSGGLGVSHHVSKVALAGVSITDMGSPSP